MGKRRINTLINKIHRHFAVCMIVVFMLSAPLFYLITKYFYAEEMFYIIESVKSGNGIPDLDLEEDIAIGMALQLVLVFLTLGISLYVSIHYVTQKLLVPFDQTLKKAESFNLALGEIPEFSKTDISEFDRLNQTLVKLMKQDSEAFRIQKEFSENASHELQTPLAVMRSKLDLLMQENLNEQQTTLVSDMYEIITRMSLLNRNLLLLAKIENAQYMTTEYADVVQLASTQIDLLKEVHQDADIKLIDKRTSPQITVRANSSLTESLLKNLIVNAVRYSKDKRDIKVIIDDNGIVVSNPATNKVPLDATTLFERFQQSSQRKGGNGLGLAIVKAVCKAQGWNVDYQFEQNAHLFKVTFHS